MYQRSEILLALQSVRNPRNLFAIENTPETNLYRANKKIISFENILVSWEIHYPYQHPERIILVYGQTQRNSGGSRKGGEEGISTFIEVFFFLPRCFHRRPPPFILTLDITVFRGANRGPERLTAESSGGTSKSFFDAIQQILTLANWNLHRRRNWQNISARKKNASFGDEAQREMETPGRWRETTTSTRCSPLGNITPVAWRKTELLNLILRRSIDPNASFVPSLFFQPACWR